MNFHERLIELRRQGLTRTGVAAIFGVTVQELVALERDPAAELVVHDPMPVAPASPADVEADAPLVFGDCWCGPFLRAPDNTLHRLVVANNGRLYTEPVE